MDVTGDSDDSDDDDSDDDDSGDSDDDDSGDDSDDDDSDDDSDDDDSGDSDDDDSDDTDSGDDSDDDDSSNGGSGSGTATTASATNFCAELTSTECGNAYTTDGYAICAVNVESNNCYAVVASSGIYGSGNYDDGYTAAQQTAQEESQKLNTIVGVLAGIITIMALGIIGGAYYLHSRTKRMSAMQDEAALEPVASTTVNEEENHML
jgi:hypothetical protein